MSEAIRISIIIPHYKRVQQLHDLLQTIALQDYPAECVEVIVVEDNSGLEENEMLEKNFPFVNDVQCYSHIGAACAKNIGARKAKYEWLVFLDDDVTLSSDWLSVMVTAIRDNPAVHCFQSKVVAMADRNILCSTGGVANIYGYAWDRGVFQPNDGRYDNKKKIIFASSCAMMIKKTFFDYLGGFDNDFFYMEEDYDLGLRIYFSGGNVQYVPAAVCVHDNRVREKESELREKYYIERNRLFLVLKNYELFLLIKIFVPLIFLKIFKYISYLFRFRSRKIQYVGDVISGWIWIVSHVQKIMVKRCEVTRIRQRTVEDLFKEFSEYTHYVSSVRAQRNGE